MSMHNDSTEMMAMESAIPQWLTPVAWFFVTLGILSAAVVLYDVYVRRYRQSERTMEAVWPITALYLGPFALWAYYRVGRAGSPKWQQENGALPEQRLSLKALAGGTPGGAAATVAHFVGVPLVIASGLTIAGTNLWVLIIFIALLAIALLFLFERFAFPAWNGGTQPGKSAGVALLAATVTVLAFDIGMGGWMIFLHFGMLMPAPTDVTFFFLMQIGNILGFATAYPAVRWLIRRRTEGPARETAISAFSGRAN